LASEPDIVQSVTRYIVEEVAPAAPAEPPAADLAIIEAGLVDSLGLFRLIAFIEDEFRVKIEPDEVLLENFGTINAIAALISKKRAT
jgi:acyl carrier protein